MADEKMYTESLQNKINENEIVYYNLQMLFTSLLPSFVSSFFQSSFQQLSRKKKRQKHISLYFMIKVKEIEP